MTKNAILTRDKYWFTLIENIIFFLQIVLYLKYLELTFFSTEKIP